MTYRFRGFHIPDRMMPSIRRYVVGHIAPGDFLMAILCNDLKNAVGYADDENLENIPAYVGYFYNEVPSGCWGSKENVERWLSSINHLEVVK